MKKTRNLFVTVAILVLALMAATSTTFAWIAANNAATGKVSSVGVTTVEEMFYIVRNPHANTTDTAKTTTANWDTTSTYIAPVSTVLKDFTLSKGITSGNVAEGGATAAADDGSYGLLRTKKGVEAATDGFIDFVFTFWSSNNTLRLLFNPTTDSNEVKGGGSKRRNFTSNDYKYYMEMKKHVDDTDGNEVMAQKVIDFFNAALPVDLPVSDIATETEFMQGFYEANARNAARVQFIGSTNVGEMPATGAFENIWDPNAGKDGSYDEITDFDVQEMYNLAVNGETSVPRQYSAPYGGIDSVVQVAAFYNGVDGTKGTTTNGSQATGTHVQTYNGSWYYRADIRIRIWLEGKDPDCFNVILGDAIEASFGFYTGT